MNKYTFTYLIFMFIFFSCERDQYVPKPPTYLRMDLPGHSYRTVSQDCPYLLKLSEIYNYKPCAFEQKNFCVQQIDLGPINGSLFLYYIEIPSKDSLPKIINFANDKVDEHKIKADKIDFKQIMNPKKNVYGTFFELKGNVATNFQFYLTDSINHFVRGEVLLNCRPNYDSLRPTLEYLKVDIMEMLNNFQWKDKKD